ncbi:hypothetical protein K3181_03980 [Qipengyuania sp. YG27]|uniref:PepSY domain-containing protein n=1 Tax=Qipengyuania mesophila TaxID=2867246 RepID=A0ABS7JSL2_9SPHN|nr:hypothetical protein [Qipengyuania mesophila]MBX7500594.1 hypothetical protein [Qipengyuania mesophila]
MVKNSLVALALLSAVMSTASMAVVPADSPQAVSARAEPQLVVLTPREAVEKAADAAPSGIIANYQMTVVATGQENGRIFLNSEEDYRDQRCLTIELSPKVQAELRKVLGDDLIAALKGKTIRVHGVAERVKIYFYFTGGRTDKYYYQTHIRLERAEDLLVVSDEG